MLHCHRNIKTNFSIGPKWASVENNIPVGLESDRFWVCAWVPPPPCCSSLSWVWSTHWHLSRSRWQGPAPPRYSPVSPAGRPARGLHNQHRKGLYSIRSKVNPFPPTNVHINEITQILMMKYWRFLLKVVRRERKSIPIPYEYNSLYRLFCGLQLFRVIEKSRDTSLVPP